MDVYILDSLLRRSQVVDKFESLIWTERYSEFGDFEIQLVSTPENRGRFTIDAHIAINGSYRVMTVETVEDTTDNEGRALLKVKGRSLETMLDDRVVKETLSDLTTEPKWVFLDTPANIARQMFESICIDGNLDISDKIPFIQALDNYLLFNIPESETPIVWEQEPTSLYAAIKNLCDIYDLGFMLLRFSDNSQLRFFIYSGNDRTTQQTALKPVIFSVNLENLQNTTEFSTVQQSKNVAYVFSSVGFEIVYGDGVDPEVEGFERRVLLVNASDVTVDTVDISGALIQKGTEELSKNRAQSYFDGEINQNNEYVYGVDYSVGDLVELRNVDGITSYKRVTEQIFVCDKEGERSYPTLTMDLFASANTWLKWANKTTVWSDFTTEFWEDM